MPCFPNGLLNEINFVTGLRSSLRTHDKVRTENDGQVQIPLQDYDTEWATQEDLKGGGKTVVELVSKLGDLLVLIVQGGINLSSLKLACGDALSKEQVNLFVRSVLGLWQAQDCPCQCGESRATPEEASVTLEVRSTRVHKVRLQDLRDDRDNVVGIAGKADGLLTKSSSSSLSSTSTPTGA